MDAILERWHSIKEEIHTLQKEEERIREKLLAAMKRKETTQIRTDNFILTVKESTRRTITKKNIPQEIWDEYSRESKVNVCRIVQLTKETTL